MMDKYEGQSRGINLIRTNPELVRCIVGGNDNG